MGYIQDIRRLVGHAALIMVGAAVLVTDDQGRLLLGRRSDNHTWGIPGGMTEPGESVEDTARRETLEEAGLQIGEMALFGVFSGPEFFYTYPNGDQVHNVSIVYTSSSYQAAQSIDDEHSTFEFFAPNALPEPLSPPIQPVIRAWLERQHSATEPGPQNP